MTTPTDLPALPTREQVLVVRRADFFGGDWPQGFVALGSAAAETLLRELATSAFFMDRAAAEQDPNHKQPIPYCVLRAPGAAFCVQRKAAQSETRLHGKLSIGLGGHVNPPATQTMGQAPPVTEDLFEATLRRELVEELHGVDGLRPRAKLLGLLNDDGNAVGQVHVGLVYAVDWPDLTGAERQVSIREISKMSGGWRSLADLRKLWQDPDRLETWTRTLIGAGLVGALAVP